MGASWVRPGLKLTNEGRNAFPAVGFVDARGGAGTGAGRVMGNGSGKNVGHQLSTPQ